MKQPEIPAMIPSVLIAGVSGGILMALLLTRILILRGYGTGMWDLLILSGIAAAVLLCGEIFSRAGLPAAMIEAVMLAVSCLFMLVYVNVTAMDQTSAVQLRRAALIPHGAALAVWCLRVLVSRKYRGGL